MAHRRLHELADPRAWRTLLPDEVVSAAWQWPRILPLAPRSILDVGASDGTIATGLAALYRPGFIGLVEPQPAALERLRTLRLAPAQLIFPCALGREPGTQTLHVLAWTYASSLLPIRAEAREKWSYNLDETEAIEVPVRTLDDVFAECPIDTLDLLKLDVQGFEGEVIAGGTETLARTRCAVLEVSFSEIYEGQPLFGDIYARFRSLGYELYSVAGMVTDPTGAPLQADAVFVNLALLTNGGRPPTPA